jgi:hypothetical protein
MHLICLRCLRPRALRLISAAIASVGLFCYLAGGPSIVLAGRSRESSTTPRPGDPHVLARRPHQLTYFIWYDTSDAAAVKIDNTDIARAIDSELSSSLGERIVRSNDATEKPAKYRDSLEKGCPEDTDYCDAVRISLKRDGDVIELYLDWHDGLMQEYDPNDTFHPHPQRVRLGECANITGDPRRIAPCKSWILSHICNALAAHKHGGGGQ